MNHQGIFAPHKAIENNSCHHCSDRQVGCHADCERYQRYKEQLEAEKEALRSSYKAQKDLDDYHIKKHNRRERIKGK